MIVPLELYVLVQKIGRLTPEIVLAWRVSRYLGEFFDGLDDVRVAVAHDGDLMLGLQATLTECRFPLHVQVEGGAPTAYHVLAWHSATGTVLEFTWAIEAVGMDGPGVGSARDARRGDAFAMAVHGASLDRQVLRLIDAPMESLCRIRVRRMDRSRSDLQSDIAHARCRRCGQTVAPSRLWLEDGVACCARCITLPEAWTHDN